MKEITAHFSTYEKIFLRDIYFSKIEIDIYHFHKKYLFSHFQLYQMIDKFKEYIFTKKEETDINKLSIYVSWKNLNIKPFEVYEKYRINDGFIECDLYPHLLEDYYYYKDMNNFKFNHALKRTKTYKNITNNKERTTIHSK